MIVSYVESVLEDLESESDLDVEDLVQTLTAYLPQSQDIPEAKVTEWIFQLAKDLRNKESKGNNEIITFSYWQLQLLKWQLDYNIDSFSLITTPYYNNIDLSLVLLVSF